MTSLNSRCAACGPCGRRALPWNASFKTIPFSKGSGAEATGFERQLEPDDPRSSGPGVSPFQGLRMKWYLVVPYRVWCAAGGFPAVISSLRSSRIGADIRGVGTGVPRPR